MASIDDARRGMRIAGGMCVGLLVKGAYDAYDVVEAMTSGRHLSAAELRRGVEAIGLPIAETPDWRWGSVAVVPSHGEGPVGFDFVAPLWTTQGQSNIGLALHLVPTEYGTFEVEVVGFVPIEEAAQDSPVPAPMARIRELAEAALRTEQPAADLEAIVRDLIAQGEAREAIASELNALVATLREGGGTETTEEEVILEVLDRLRGWSAPEARF
jgi:hypothetical protein